MKTLITTLLFLMPAILYAEVKNEKKSQKGLLQTSANSNQNEQQGDSLPAGVTQDWLNSLRDEEGNRILNENEPVRNPDDPETDAIQRKVFNGLSAGSQFGYFVRSAGDVNADGYDDIIIGAPAYSSNTGRAYIFFGGINMNTVADVTMTGGAANNSFGLSVSSAGDVNGDGYDDVIVGAFGYSTSTGRAYIYFGGAAMNNVADVIMTGETTNSRYGYWVSSAGDVNGDGYSDVIVGAYLYSSSTGRAYIYFGGASMNNVADVIMTGFAANDQFGTSVASAGDVNGDGYDDVIVGANNYFFAAGRVYIYFGGAAMDNVADVIMTGIVLNGYFGTSVSAGDVNGDGYSDIIVGAFGYSSSTGRAYIFYGGAAMDNVADVIMTGENTNDRFGLSLSSAGDVNGDGYSDVIVGAYQHNSNTGKAYVFFGKTTMDNVPDITMTGEATNNYFGWSVSSAGDVNGDGYSDLIVGGYGYSSSTGRVYLFDYFMKGDLTADLFMTGEGIDNYLGYSVSSAGDVNGDGYSDVIVGANLYFFEIGRAYIYFGGSTMDNAADVIMTGGASGDRFGVYVSSAGDVNGDGYSDVIVGAEGYSTNTGRAYIYFGAVTMDNVADITMTGETTSNLFGISVSSAGDVNGDGYSDVIVGAVRYSSFTGRAYIYLGGSAMDNIADVTMTGEGTSNSFGYSVSSGGDVNGDGYSDVIVGAYMYSSFTGRAYIYFGGAVMNNVVDVIMTGGATGDRFGISVSSAEDLNGDGYSDVIVGANGYSSITGRAYIYYGGASMNNIADVILTGEELEYFGSSVSSAGDVNGDGYSDVFVGAHTYNGTGRAYIYFGGTAMNDVADVTMTGVATGNWFGNSVSFAGDINGDGYSDLIVGASRYNDDTGRAYLYHGSAISAKPILNYVRDVPNDQGGFVNLKWARSSYDVNGNDLITQYIVERSFPPSGGNFSWNTIATISSNKNSFYSLVAQTPYDSSANTTGTFYFRVTARTSTPSQYWRSGILYGRSIDNLAPPMVSPFTAASSGSNVRLNWGKNSAPDLYNYILYRSTSPTIDPNSEPVFAMSTDTTYLDTSPLSGTYYYFIVAQDIHNNTSPVAMTEAPQMILNLTAFIQGFYNPSSDVQVSDTVTIQLRNSASPFAVADVSKAVIGTNGTAQFSFTTASPGNYYIAFKHRNSIETWSPAPISFSNSVPAAHDFTASVSLAYGSNMMQIDNAPVRFGIYNGDVDQDGTVDASDLSLIDNDATNFAGGYVPTDVNGDSFIDGTDYSIADNNATNFVSVIRP